MKFMSLLYVLLSLPVFAQQIQPKLGENILENNGILFEQFKQKITSLKSGKIQKIRILHIGDSHIQPDNLSGIVRKNFQSTYGNGGRGLVFPYTLAKTNGPKDFSATSASSWNNHWIINYPHKFKIGLPGIGIKSTLDSGNITFNFIKDSLKSPFTNGFIIYSFQAEKNGHISVSPSFKKNSNQLMFDTLHFDFKSPQTKLDIKFTGSKLLFHSSYFENEQPGIVYNAAGVAGARYRDFLSNEFFTKQLPYFQPDMLILSLGTNESYDPTFTTEGFRSRVDSMFTMIQSKLPNCAVIITLPSENYRIKNSIPIVNDRIEIISDILRKESTRFGYSIWDLKKAMGGDGSMLQWKEAGLVNKDYLHFLRKGYNLQGKLLFEAIHKELNAN